MAKTLETRVPQKGLKQHDIIPPPTTTGSSIESRAVETPCAFAIPRLAVLSMQCHYQLTKF